LAIETRPTRSSSPSQLQKAKSFSPQQQPVSPKRVPVHYSWSGAGSAGVSHHSQEHVNNTTSDTSLWSPASNEKELLDTVSYLEHKRSTLLFIYFFLTLD
jgi:hypothetical protein